MSNKFPHFDEYQQVAKIVTIIKDKVHHKTDVVWIGYDSPEQLSDYLAVCIEQLRAGDSETLSRIFMMFLPTGTFQELSVSNGWGNEYIEISGRFVYLLGQIRKI